MTTLHLPRSDSSRGRDPEERQTRHLLLGRIGVRYHRDTRDSPETHTASSPGPSPLTLGREGNKTKEEGRPEVGETQWGLRLSTREYRLGPDLGELRREEGTQSFLVGTPLGLGKGRSFVVGSLCPGVTPLRTLLQDR